MVEVQQVQVQVWVQTETAQTIMVNTANEMLCGLASYKEASNGMQH